MSLNYAMINIGNAVSSLACLDAPLRDRLHSACVYNFAQIVIVDLPEEVRADFKRALQEMKATPANMPYLRKRRLLFRLDLLAARTCVRVGL